MERKNKFTVILDESGHSSGAGFLKDGEALDFNYENFKEMLTSLGYKINHRYFGETQKLFSKDYSRFDFKYDINRIIYSGAEHTGKPKLPNITVLPNLQANQGVIVLGSTMGHQHTQAENGDTRKFQEIYEFQNYGAMLLRNQKRNYTRLHILKPNEKIGVRTDDNMTIFNLGNSPLITLDYANSDKNEAQKDLEKKLGSFMTISHQKLKNGKNTTFYLNDNYISKNPVTITHTNLGQSLYEKIRIYKENFKNQNIELSFGENLSSEQQIKLNKPLIELVLEKNKTLFETLEIRD